MNIYKSSNPSTRQGGFLAICALQSRSEPYTGLVLDALLDAFQTDRPGTEERLMIAKSIAGLRLSEQMVELLVSRTLSMLAKETNEPVQLELIKTLLRTIEQKPEVHESIIGVLRKGIIDKKANIRNAWLCGLAELCRKEPLCIVPVGEKIYQDMIKVWQTDAKTPVQTFQAGQIAGSYASLTFLLKASSLSSTIRESSFSLLLQY